MPGYIFNREDREYWLAPGHGMTPRKKEAYLYERSIFDRMFNADEREFIEFIEIGTEDPEETLP